MALPLAHAGHWYFLPLYAAPVLVVISTLVAIAVRERRRSREGQGSGERDPG
jgi:hypothetical protein